MSIERFGLDPDGKLGLSNDDVVMLASQDFSLEKMSKISQVIQAIERWSAKNTNNKGVEGQWFTEKGLQCEILRTVGGGWQKGRIRFRLEFVPDSPEIFDKKPVAVPVEPESPLADLRNLNI